MNQSSYKKSTLIIVILIITSLAIGYFITTPQWSKHTESKGQLERAQSDNKKLTDQLAVLQSFLSSYNSNLDKKAVLNQAVPVKSPDLANFMASVDALAKSSGVALSNISIGTNAAAQKIVENSIQTVPLNLTASGSYPSFKDFILRLEQHLRLVDVGHVALKSDENGLLEYRIDVSIYYQR